MFEIYFKHDHNDASKKKKEIVRILMTSPLKENKSKYVIMTLNPLSF